MNKLHPGARWLFRLRAYSPLFIIGIFISANIFQVLRLLTGGSMVAGFILTIIFYIFFVILVAEIYARMSYNRYLYEITHDAIKIERGIIWKKYTSIPYERVQNVDIKRGIIARMFGFSTTDIQTAGYSGGYSRHGGRIQAEGHIPAVSTKHAEEIRDFVMHKITRKNKRESGGI